MVFLRSEKANENYTTGFIKKLFTEEGKDVFATRASTLGKKLLSAENGQGWVKIWIFVVGTNTFTNHDNFFPLSCYSCMSMYNAS